MDNNFDFTIITSYATGIPEIRNYELHDNRQVTMFWFAKLIYGLQQNNLKQTKTSVLMLMIVLFHLSRDIPTASNQIMQMNVNLTENCNKIFVKSNLAYPEPDNLKIDLFKNFTICSGSYKNNTLKISDS